MATLRASAAILSSIVLSAPAWAALPKAVDGIWYNPDQSGHGLTIERIDHDSALLFWQVFDLAGNPLSLYVEATVDGDTFSGLALAPAGMRFGPFNDATLSPWGRIDVSFADCSHATLSYQSSLPGFGRGEIPLVRLLPGVNDCALNLPAGLSGMPAQYLSGSIRGAFSAAEPMDLHYPSAYGGDLYGFVTREGGVAMAGDIDYLGFHSLNFVATGSARPSSAGEAQIEVEVYPNGWLDPVLHPGLTHRARGGRKDRFVLPFQAKGQRAKAVLFPLQIAPGTPDGEFSVFNNSPVKRGRLRPGNYPFSRYYGVDPTFRLEVANDLTLCVRPLVANAPSQTLACVYSGNAVEGEGHFTFTLRPRDDAWGPAFSGVGEFDDCGFQDLFCTDALLLVASNGITGLGIYTTDVPHP